MVLARPHPTCAGGLTDSQWRCGARRRKCRAPASRAYGDGAMPFTVNAFAVVVRPCGRVFGGGEGKAHLRFVFSGGWVIPANRGAGAAGGGRVLDIGRQAAERGDVEETSTSRWMCALAPRPRPRRIPIRVAGRRCPLNVLTSARAGCLRIVSTICATRRAIGGRGRQHRDLRVMSFTRV